MAERTSPLDRVHVGTADLRSALERALARDLDLPARPIGDAAVRRVAEQLIEHYRRRIAAGRAPAGVLRPARPEAEAVVVDPARQDRGGAIVGTV